MFAFSDLPHIRPRCLLKNRQHLSTPAMADFRRYLFWLRRLLPAA